ncbi:MAG TPA: right-handed parallel beta-helix repeat-containing protein [Brumimicrobium sp.]|nr:right-handed parallel beta-helix repeat-containing protein [Brumimicrobium sp.]
MKSHIFILVFFIVSGIAIFNLSSCKKDVLFSSEHLSFSADTVLFDTVFTTVGSTTKRLKIYNESNRPIKINQVILEGGKNSPFRVNLDGEPGTQFKDVLLPANDSLFMFVEVTIEENTYTNSPFIIQDSIRFVTNGKDQFVQIAAWGQDAYFYRNEEVVNNVWDNDKPHVIYGVALVDSLSSLTILPGTKVHFHKGSMLYVKGELHVQGTFTDKVVFEGDRLESFYKDVKGQYYGIYFDRAFSSTIDNAIIKNGTAGIHLYGNHPNNTGYTLEIRNTEIFNHASYGIFNYSGGKVKGENLNIHSNDVYAYFLLEGGDHNFTHSQFLSYGAEGNHPAVAIKNYFTRNDGFTYLGDINEGSFYNSIIYGNGEYQIGYDTLTNGGMVSIHYDYNTNFIRQGETLSGPNFVNNTWNTNPKFESIAEQNFKIQSSSPCVGAGSNAFYLSTDIEGNARDTDTPDIGAYEVQ